MTSVFKQSWFCFQALTTMVADYSKFGWSAMVRPGHLEGIVGLSTGSRSGS